jgi:Na+/H+ antiporter NhaD/arsenite permease-like protein
MVPLIFLSFRLKGNIERPLEVTNLNEKPLPEKQQAIVFFSGVTILMLVPVFKTITHLPPYMGILFGLGVLWIITEMIHGNKDEEDKHILSVVHALRKIDSSSILFFMGILLSVAALQSLGVLKDLASWMTLNLGNENVIVLSIGLLSSIIDNVPLVAATQGMYKLSQYPMDHNLWEFIAYCAGTGGSILIIGSAAGIAAMGLEKIHFFWYLRNISLLALLGYLAGAVAFLLQNQVIGH